MPSLKNYILCLLLIPFCIYAQNSSKKAAGEKIYLVPNFDTTKMHIDTLQKGKNYSFTLIGIDSASVSKVLLGGVNCPIRKGVGNTTLIIITAPEWHVVGENATKPAIMKLAVYKRSDNSICFMKDFISMSEARR